MADLIRELVDQYIVGQALPPTDLSDLAGVVRTGHRTDIAAERDRMLADALRGIH
jgi:hypothetical protein